MASTRREVCGRLVPQHTLDSHLMRVLLLAGVALGGAHAQCDWAEFGSSSAAVNTACCAGPNEHCDGGLPTGCGATCAAVFVPFMSR